MIVSVTKLRKELFKLMDQIAQSGEPVFVERNGIKIKISRDESSEISKFDRIKEFQGESVLKCPIEEIENIEWDSVWEPHIWK